jgi:hypothetical protein
VRLIFDRLFREYGLPRALRTDNGVPFASTSLHGLTPLNTPSIASASSTTRSGPTNS